MQLPDRIKQKAEELFIHYGIRAITMDEIASQLGLSKKTIYQFYRDKNALVDDVIETILDRARNDAQSCAIGSKDAIDMVFRTGKCIEAAFVNMNPSVFFDLQRYYVNVYKKFMDFRSQFLYNAISENLYWGIAEGLYREDINVEILSRYRIGGMMLVFDPETFPGASFNILKVQNEIIEHFLFGLVTMKGYKLILKYKADILKQIPHDTDK